MENLRKQYTQGGIELAELDANPIQQLRVWFEIALANIPADWFETNAVTLAGAGDPQLFAIFIATISLNVAVFNTLPVPGLDGGQMAFLAIDALAETVGRPRLDRRVKEGVGVVFALALTGLALSVLLSDMGHVVDGLLGKR